MPSAAAGNSNLLPKSEYDMRANHLQMGLVICRDSHAKSLYRALQCFLLDFWNHQECESSPESWKVDQLLKLPAAPGQSYCFHLLGPGGGRVCVVHAVLG